MNRTARPYPPARDSYMSNSSAMTDSSQSTVMTDIWDHGNGLTGLGSPGKAGWRTSQIGSHRNYGYGASASSRPFYKRASTNITIPDESPEKKDKVPLLEEVEEAAEHDTNTVVEEDLEGSERMKHFPEADEEVTITFGQDAGESKTKAETSPPEPLFGGTTSWTSGYPTSPSARGSIRSRPAPTLFCKPVDPETSSPLPDRQALRESPRRGSRTSHIAAALEALESKAASSSEGALPTTPTRSKPSKRVSSTIQSISKSRTADQDAETPASGMKASPSIMALRNTGGIKNRISMIEQTSEGLPPTDAFRITPGPRQIIATTASCVPKSPIPSLRSPSQRSSRLLERSLSRRTTITTQSRAGASSFADFIEGEESAGSDMTLAKDDHVADPLNLQSPVETYESFGVESFYGEGSRLDADKGDLAEREGDIRSGSLLITPSGNLINLPHVAPLNLHRPASSIASANWQGEQDQIRLKTVREFDVMTPELSDQGTRSTEQGQFQLLTPTLSDTNKAHDLPHTPPREEDAKTVSPSHFSTSKSLRRRARVPPPELTPKTAATSVFRAPSTKTVRTAAWIQGTTTEPDTENVDPGNAIGLETASHAKAMIDRFEAQAGIDDGPANAAKSLPSTPIKRSARQIGLGTPPVRGNQTESRIPSGRTGMRGELSGSYANNRNKPLPAIYPYESQRDAGLRPPERAWTSEEVVIPVSPPRVNGKSSSPWNAGHSPLKGIGKKGGKSPLKDFMGRLHGVRNKVKSEVGRRRAGTLEKVNKTPSWVVPAYRAGGGTDPVEDVFGNMSPLPAKPMEKEAENGLGPDVGVAHSVLSSSVTPSQTVPLVRDRMGDAEMQIEAPLQEMPQSVLRQSTGFCLLPPPCSTTDTIGLWVPSDLMLTIGALSIKPAFEKDSWHVNTQECSDIRSLSSRQAMEQGIPPVFTEDGNQADILELSFGESSPRRYIAVEGLANRLGWVSALWDAILASQRRTDSVATSDRHTQGNSVFYTPFAMGLQSSGPLTIRNRDATPASTSTLRMASDSTPRASPRMASALRNSVQGMFETPVEGRTLADLNGENVEDPNGGLGLYGSHTPIPAERELSLFSRTRSLARRKSTSTFIAGMVPSAADGSEGIPSFDESDLNPSRSASQCARPARSEVDFVPQSHQAAPTRARYPGRALPQPKMPSLLGPRPGPRGIPPAVGLDTGQTGNESEPESSVPEALTARDKDLPPQPDDIHDETEQPHGEITATNEEAKEPTKGSHIEIPELAGDGVFPVPEAPVEVELPVPEAPIEVELPVPEVAVEKEVPAPAPEVTKAADIAATATGPPADGGEGIPTQPANPNAEEPKEADVPAGEEQVDLPTKTDLDAQLETVRAEARFAFSQSKLLQEQTDAIRTQAEAVRALSPLVTKVDSVHLDIKEIQNSLQIAALSALKQAETSPLDLDAVHDKLDALVLALSKQAISEPNVAPLSKEPVSENKAAADLVPAATPAEVNAPSPIATAVVDEALKTSLTEMTEGQTALADQVKEVLSVVEGIQAARAAQTQQTADMAKYLGQLNGWLEQFVIGSTKEMQNVTGRLDRLVKELAPEPTPAPDGGEPPAPARQGVASLVNQVHDLMLEQKQRTDEDASTAQRVDNLLNQMVEDRNSWTTSLDTVRQENEQLLRAMATDLTSEIRGERLRFVEAMREATSVNVSLHIEEFKNMLNTEVSRNMQELTQMREQKRTLELQLSDYFALMAKTNKASDGAGVSSS